MSAPKFTSVGCYPLVYVLPDGDCLCGDCVDDHDAAYTADVHWEGEPISCDDCGAEIESEYGVPS